MRITRHAALATGVASLTGAISALPAPTAGAQAQRIVVSTSQSPTRPDARPVINAQQLAQLAEIVSMDEAQRTVAEVMLEQYRNAFDDSMNTLREKQRALRDEASATGDFSPLLEGVPPLVEAHAKRARALEDDLMKSLKSLLSETQLAEWPRFERELRRTKLLPDARLAGEDVDLFELIAQLDLSPSERAAIAKLRERYAIEMDNALRSRDRAIENMREDWRAHIRNNDREAAGEIWESATGRRKVVAGVNKRYVEQFAIQLEDPHGAALREAWLRAAYPRAFETTRAERVLEAVTKLDSLTNEQAARIDAIAEDYHRRLAPIRDRIISRIDAKDGEQPPIFNSISTSGSGNSTVLFVAGASGGGDDGERTDPLQEALLARFQLSKTTIGTIEMLLTPDQREALPQNSGQSEAIRLSSFRFNL